MTQNQVFQIELERFKQKFSWESRFFYLILAGLFGIFLKSTDTGQFLDVPFWAWLLFAGLFAWIMEFLTDKYLDKQKKELIEKFS